MTVEQLEAWIKERRFNGANGARALGISPAALSYYRRGIRPIPDNLLTRAPSQKAATEVVEPEPVNADIEAAEIVEFPAETERSSDTETVIAEVVDAYDLPPGSEGWRYRPGSVLPKGQFTERLLEPRTYPNGAVCTVIRWGSNGVGMPSMTLIGTTKDMADPVHDRASNYYPLARGVYRPAELEDAAARPAPADGKMAVGNIKGPYQKSAPKPKRGGKSLMDMLDGDE